MHTGLVDFLMMFIKRYFIPFPKKYKSNSNNSYNNSNKSENKNNKNNNNNIYYEMRLVKLLQNHTNVKLMYRGVLLCYLRRKLFNNYSQEWG